jgi:hypothetical protein
MWNHKRGFKFYLYSSRYTYNGHVLNENLESMGGDRHHLKGKKFVSFERLARVFKDMTQSDKAANDQPVTPDSVSFKS